MKRALAALLFALLPAPLRAQAPAPSSQAAPPPRDRPPLGPLSKEDEAVLKEMALLERVELLRNLELFEQKDEGRRAAETPRHP